MTSDTVVIGGGLIGCSIAWRLAQRARSVHLFESHQAGRAASWAAAGMLAPLIEAHHEDFLDIARASISLYPRFVGELEALSGIDCDLYIEDELGSVDNRRLTEAVSMAARAAGAQVEEGAPVVELLRHEGATTGVRLAGGRIIESPEVILCAGAWSGNVQGLPRRLPVFPVRGQMLAFKTQRRLLPNVLITESCYLVPRSDGRLLVGATVENVGFDSSTTDEGIAHLRDAAISVLPELADAPVLATWAGLRPGTPDELPILGDDPDEAGLYYATGHYRNGILLAPVTAEIICDLVTTGGTKYAIEAFAPDRFDDRASQD